MARKYVKYEDVREGLKRGGDDDFTMPYSPYYYLRELRVKTGLSWAKLAHDLSADSGCEVSAVTARRWANG